MDAYDSAVKTAKILHKAGFEAYIIGGAVRDLLLNKQPKDFDLGTNATPEQIRLIPEFKTATTPSTSQAYGVTHLKIDGHSLELATFRTDIGAHLGRKLTKVEYSDLEDDLARRDFTVNSLALDPLTNQVIDYQGGLEDIQNKTIHFIGNPLDRIKEDPLRVLRAVRFKNDLSFNFHQSTYKALSDAVHDGVIDKIPIDRLRHELTIMLTHSSRRGSLEDLDKLGILRLVLPEVTAGKGIEQPPEFHSEGDVWTHQLLVMEALPANPSRQLAWAALLHDIGKAKTQTLPISDDGRIRFDNHYEVGATMTEGILKRLNFSNIDCENITWMVRHHLSIDDLPNMRPSKQKAMLGHPAFADLLELHKADAMASWHINQPRSKPSFSKITKIWQEYNSKPAEQRQPSLKKDLAIDGDWLLSEFGEQFKLSRGPFIGKILEELKELYIDKGISDKSELKKYAEALIKAESGYNITNNSKLSKITSGIQQYYE